MAVSLSPGDGFITCREMQVKKTIGDEKKVENITRIGDEIFTMYAMHKLISIVKRT